MITLSFIENKKFQKVSKSFKKFQKSFKKVSILDKTI